MPGLIIPAGLVWVTDLADHLVEPGGGTLVHYGTTEADTTNSGGEVTLDLGPLNTTLY